MAPPEADSISQLSVAISDAVAKRNAMEVRGTTDGCSLASYYARVGGGGDWLEMCVTRADSTAVKFYIAGYRTGGGGAKGDDLRTAKRDTRATHVGARLRGEQ